MCIRDSHHTGGHAGQRRQLYRHHRHAHHKAGGLYGNGLDKHDPVSYTHLGWRQGVYPTRTDARRAQASGALYLAWDGARAIGSMVLNHDADPDYAQVPGLSLIHI